MQQQIALTQVILTLTAAQWNEIAAGLGERPLKLSGPVLQECERQILEQHRAVEILKKPADPPKAPE